MTTVIDRLKIKGSPAPRNSPTSPLLATSKANRPIPSTVISLDKSYEYVMRHASKNTMDIAFHMSAASRRMNYLNRLQHANFGMTSTESALINSEDHPCEEKPNFVLCGQPVNGLSPKTLNNYFREERVGNYKTSAREILRMRQNASKAKSEPSSRSRSEESYEPERQVKTSHGIRKHNMNSEKRQAIASAPPGKSRSSKKSPQVKKLELQGHNFKGCSPEDWRNSPSRDFIDYKPLRNPMPATRREATNESMKSHLSVMDIQACMLVNSSTPRNNTNSSSANYDIQNDQPLFVKRGMGIHNNPYRSLKGRDKKALIGNKMFDMQSIKRMATSLDSPTLPNEKYVDMPKSILKVPSQCTDTFLLQMMLELNRPLSRGSKTGKYSDIALQRDLDEYMVVRTPSCNSPARSSPIKSLTQRSVKSNLNDLEEESTCIDNDMEDEIR